MASYNINKNLMVVLLTLIVSVLIFAFVCISKGLEVDIKSIWFNISIHGPSAHPL